VNGDNVNLETIAANKNTIKINDVNNGNDDKIALHTINNSTHANARALKVEGVSEFLGRTEANQALIKVKRVLIETVDCDDWEELKISPGIGNDQIELFTASGIALFVVGKLQATGDATIGGTTYLNGVTIATQQLQARKEILVGNVVNQDGGKIDAAAPGEETRVLYLGTEETTGNVEISQDGNTTKIKGDLDVHGDFITNGSIDGSGANDLKLGTEGGGTYVLISRAGGTTKIQNIGIVEGLLALGKGAEAVHGVIDCNAVEANNMDLKIGGQNFTRNVILSRAGKTTQVQGALDVDQNANFDGTLHVDGNVDFDGTLQVDGTSKLSGNLTVGPGAGAGTIDSNGIALVQQDLKIGSGDGTKDVLISKDGQRTDILGNTRFNGNQLVVNNVANLAAANGCGLVYNAPNNRIDFYVGGVVVGWVNANGFIDAP
jgi:hypothetical protein